MDRKSVKLYLGLVFMALICAGCGDAKLDVSSDKAYGESVRKLYDSVPAGERESFLKNFSAVLSSIPKFGSVNINEKDLFALYDFVKLLGGEEGVKMLQPVNGLTVKQINEKGRVIRKDKLAERLASLQKALPELEKEIARDNAHLENLKKIFVSVKEVEPYQYIDPITKKPVAQVAGLRAVFTLKNDSSAVLRDVKGQVEFKGLDPDKRYGWKHLSDSWRADGVKIEGVLNRNMNLAPGSEVELVLEETLDIMSRRQTPYPTDKKFEVVISDFEPILEDSMDRPQYAVDSRAKQLSALQGQIKSVEQEIKDIEK